MIYYILENIFALFIIIGGFALIYSYKCNYEDVTVISVYVIAGLGVFPLIFTRMGRYFLDIFKPISSYKFFSEIIFIWIFIVLALNFSTLISSIVKMFEESEFPRLRPTHTDIIFNLISTGLLVYAVIIAVPENAAIWMTLISLDIVTKTAKELTIKIFYLNELRILFKKKEK